MTKNKSFKFKDIKFIPLKEGLDITPEEKEVFGAYIQSVVKMYGMTEQEMRTLNKARMGVVELPNGLTACIITGITEHHTRSNRYSVTFTNKMGEHVIPHSHEGKEVALFGNRTEESLEELLDMVAYQRADAMKTLDPRKEHE